MSPTSGATNAAAGSPRDIPLLIGGEWRVAAGTFEVRDPYRGTVVARAPRASPADLDAALDAAVKAKPKIAAMPAPERAAILRRAITLLLERADLIAEIMTR